MTAGLRQFQLDPRAWSTAVDEPAAAQTRCTSRTATPVAASSTTRAPLRLHLDATNPDRLMARVMSLTGHELASNAAAIELVHKLATIFYQLG